MTGPIGTDIIGTGQKELVQKLGLVRITGPFGTDKIGTDSIGTGPKELLQKSGLVRMTGPIGSNVCIV